MAYTTIIENANEGVEYISLTKIAKIIEEQTKRKVKYNFLHDSLVRNRYITEDNLILDNGKKLDIKLCKNINSTTNEINNEYLVYNKEKVVKFFIEHIDVLIKNYDMQELDEDGFIKNPIKKNSNNIKTKKIGKNASKEELLKLYYCEECKIYPYLNIPDNFVIIDTETTGFSKNDVVVELGIIDNKGNVLYNSYFNSNTHISQSASNINHITQETIKDAPFFNEEWGKIKKILDGKIILGHNISYDMRLIEQTLAKELQRSYSKEVEKLFENRRDTLSLAKEFINTKSYSLNNLVKLVGINKEEKHSALDDCLLTKEFLDKLNNLIDMRIQTNFIKL